MKIKKSNPALEKLEEKEGKDLDHDGEKGESSSHRKKVFSKEIPSGGLKKSSSKGMPFGAQKKSSSGAGKMCPACTKAGKMTCSHL